MKLTPTMSHALKLVAEMRSSLNGVRANTLSALERRGLIESSMVIGYHSSYPSPRT